MGNDVKILQAKNVSKRFGGVIALQNVDIELFDEEIVGLIGPNGAGKSTLFDIITGILKPDIGNIFFENKEITSQKTNNIARMGIGRTFQLTRLFPKMTVAENLLVAETLHKGEEFWHSLIGGKIIAEEEAKNFEKAQKLLELVELQNKQHNFAEQLSFGQQKLLEIAKVLALNPKLVLLDEPGAGLNPEITKKVFGLIKELKKNGKTVFLIEHEMKHIASVCDRVIALDFGRIIAEGKPKEIQKNKKVIEAYLGVSK